MRRRRWKAWAYGHGHSLRATCRLRHARGYALGVIDTIFGPVTLPGTNEQLTRENAVRRLTEFVEFDRAHYGKLAKAVSDRYSSWNSQLAQDTLAGKVSLADLSKYVLDKNVDPAPTSGRQEYLENLLNQYI